MPSCQVNSFGELTVYNRDCSKLVPKPVLNSKQSGEQAAQLPRPNPRDRWLSSKWRPLFLRVLLVGATMGTAAIGRGGPGKGIRNMDPRVSGLFYFTRLQANLVRWKIPHNFASNKVLRWIDHGVKVEFKN